MHISSVFREYKLVVCAKRLDVMAISHTAIKAIFFFNFYAFNYWPIDSATKFLGVYIDSNMTWNTNSNN